METNKKCKECGEEFQNEIDDECPKCGNGKRAIKNVKVTLHTYREGGSMICEEQVVGFGEEIPTRLQIRKLVGTYRRVKNWDGRVFVALNFSEIVAGSKREVSNDGSDGKN